MQRTRFQLRKKIFMIANQKYLKFMVEIRYIYDIIITNEILNAFFKKQRSAIKMYSVGIDIGGTKIAYGLFDGNNKLIDKTRSLTPQNLLAEDFFQYVKRDVEKIANQNNIFLADIEGIGVGMPGSIRYPDGYVVVNSNIPKLAGFGAGDYLKKIFLNTNIEVDNDAHAAALGESRYGAGRGFDNMIYCAVSSGISSAMVIGGKIFKGSNGFSGESGHMLITPDQEREVYCPCGNDGCFMSWCSGQMITKHVHKWIAEGEKTKISDMVKCPKEISTLEIMKAWEQGDMLAKKAIEQMQHYFALWFFNIYVFVNIDCFVLGGGLLKLGNRFWNEIYKQFEGYKKTNSKVTFKEAELGDDMGIIGAHELLY